MADKTGKPFRLPAGVIPLCNNSALTSIIAMMPVFNAHGLDNTGEEVAYIASRAEEAALAEEAGSVSFVEDEASAEEDFAERGEPIGEHSGTAAGGPSAEETAEGEAEEEPHEEPPVPGKKRRVLWRAISDELVQQASSHEEGPSKGAAGKDV
jgi:hypothetical protein